MTALALAAWCAIATRPFVRGLSLVVRGGGVQGLARDLANIGTVPAIDRTSVVPLKQGSLRGRVYLPLRSARQTVLLIPGLQVAGIDDSRIVLLARELARSGITVLTPASSLTPKPTSPHTSATYARSPASGGSTRAIALGRISASGHHREMREFQSQETEGPNTTPMTTAIAIASTQPSAHTATALAVLS